MIIGINAAAAVKIERTGVEGYVCQLIKHLTMLPEAREYRFLLYVPSLRKIKSPPPQMRRGLRGGVDLKFQHPSPALPSSEGRGEANDLFDFTLPDNFQIKILRWPLPVFWTQIRLAWEIWRRPPEALFIPAHILPAFSPKNSVVAIHGLEYEYFPRYYSAFFRWYLRWSTKRAVKKARRVIAVSESTKKDLVELYGCEAGKIKVVYHGISHNPFLRQPADYFKLRGGEIPPSPPLQKGGGIPPLKVRGGQGELCLSYILYIGRLETKKNVQGILAAYKILKEKYGVPHQLILAGGRGFGYKTLRPRSGNIREIGYVSENEKWQLLSNADLFLFPSFYEGFGLPILEAQAAGAPVITSYNSSMPEVAGEGAVFINPKNPEQIAETAHKILEDAVFRDKITAAGYENVKRFSWEKCARETLKTVLNYG